MTKTFPISKTHYQIILANAQKVQAAQTDLNNVYALVLATHDVTNGQITGLTETEITVDIPDTAEGPAPEASAPKASDPKASARTRRPK